MKVVAAILLLLLGLPICSRAYSVLTHEAIIDSAWDDAIKPLLLKRFPSASPEDLKQAHSYAYGGAIIADAGYYPFGNKFFSDLIHYVRSADFVEALVRDSQDVNEYAFALGALAHYVADNNGHRLAVNLAVPILYPKLQRRYGNRVMYDQSPGAHLKTEFGFDVAQVAKGHYASDSYHDYIGFNVSKPLLEKAFQETYSIELRSIFVDYDLALGTFRRSVSIVIPEMTKVAWDLKKDEIQKDIPGITKKKFMYNLSQASYEKEWKGNYHHIGFGTRFLALIIRLIPKIGPFRALSFRAPTPETEKLFMASFNATIQQYEQSIRDLRNASPVPLVNDNLDTGAVTAPGEYPLADKTYAELLDRLAKDHFANVSPQRRDDVLAYYIVSNATAATKKHKKDWSRVEDEIRDLKSYAPPANQAASPVMSEQSD